MTKQNYALAVAQAVAEAALQVLSNYDGEKLTGDELKAIIAAVPRPEPVAKVAPCKDGSGIISVDWLSSPQLRKLMYGQPLYTEQPAPAGPGNARLLDDAAYSVIDAAARISFHNYKRQIRGQQITLWDDPYAHFAQAALNWATEQQQALTDLSAVQHDIQPGYVSLPELSDEKLTYWYEKSTNQNLRFQDKALVFSVCRAVIAADRELRGWK